MIKWTVFNVQRWNEQFWEFHWWVWQLRNFIWVNPRSSKSRCRKIKRRKSYFEKVWSSFKEARINFRIYWWLRNNNKGWNENVCWWTLDDTWRVRGKSLVNNGQPKTRNGNNETLIWYQTNEFEEENSDIYRGNGDGIAGTNGDKGSRNW